MTNRDQSEVQHNTKEERVRSRRIGSRLRKLYDDVTKEDIPTDFLDLLKEADENSNTETR